MTEALYRVQGGIFPKRSRKILTLDKKICCSPNNFLYISNMEHMSYFFKKRIDFRSLDKLGDKIKNYELEIVKMIVPSWFMSMLETHAVDQFNSKNNLPKIVDTKKPGKAFQLNGNWIKLLEKVCIDAEIIKIESTQDFAKAFDFEMNKFTKKLVLNQEIIDIFEKCEINRDIINQFKSRLEKKMSYIDKAKGENFDLSDIR